MPHMRCCWWSMSREILNMAWSVRPPLIRFAASPLEGVARTILPRKQIADRIKLIRNVLPVPPDTLRNIRLPAKQCTVSSHAKWFSFWLSLTASPCSVVILISGLVHQLHEAVEDVTLMLCQLILLFLHCYCLLIKVAVHLPEVVLRQMLINATNKPWKPMYVKEEATHSLHLVFHSTQALVVDVVCVKCCEIVDLTTVLVQEVLSQEVLEQCAQMGWVTCLTVGYNCSKHSLQKCRWLAEGCLFRCVLYVVVIFKKSKMLTAMSVCLTPPDPRWHHSASPTLHLCVLHLQVFVKHTWGSCLHLAVCVGWPAWGSSWYLCPSCKDNFCC